MKRITLWVALGAVGAWLLVRTVGPPAVRAQSTCSENSFQGGWGYTLQGWSSSGSAFAAAGRLLADGSGRLTGIESASLGGNLVGRAYNGFYSVGPNCAGSILLGDTTGLVRSFDFVIVNGGVVAQAIQTDGGTVVTGQFRRQ